VRYLGFLAVVALMGGCGRGADRGDLDTSMVFYQLRVPTAADSVRAPSQDSVLATIRAYNDKRIQADVAAPIIVNYLIIGRTLNVDMDQQLQSAVTEEIRRRMAP
jgi:hypothetical protein